MNEREREEPVAGALDVSLGVGEERAALTKPEAPGAAPARAEDVWTKSESLPRSIWRAARAAVFGAVGFYSIMRLMGDDITAARAALIGAWTGIVAFGSSRTGSMAPAMPLLIFGGVTVGIGVVGSAAAIVAGIDPLASLAVASVPVFLGSILLWMGLKSRRAERSLEAGLKGERIAPVLISRQELTSRLEAVQQENVPETRRLVKRLVIGGAVVMGILAFPYVRVFGAEPPEAVGFGILFGMWGAVGLLARHAARRAHGIAARFGLICPACDKPYGGAFVNHRFQKNIVEIGRCPRCGVRIVTEEG